MTRDERLQRLERVLERALKTIERQNEIITELRVQMRFALGSIVLKRPPREHAIVTPGAPEPPSYVTAFEIYNFESGRDLTLQILTEESLQSATREMVAEAVENGDTRPLEIIAQEARAKLEGRLDAFRSEAESGGSAAAADAATLGRPN